MIELALGAAVYAFVLMKAWDAAKTDHELAKKGIVPPRQQAKYGDQAAGKVARYGFRNFLKDAWNDYWPRRTEALIAARDAKATNPGRKVSWRERLAAAKAKVTELGRKVNEKVVQPREPKPVDPPTTPEQPPLAVDTGDVEPGTRRFTDTGQEEWDGTTWRPVPSDGDSTPVGTLRFNNGVDESWDGTRWVPLPPLLPNPRTAPTGKPAPTSTGGTMTAPTGEAVNYETTIVELDKLEQEQQTHLEQCIAAEAAINTAAGAIGDMQDSYRSSSAAAASTHEHLSALNLDGATLAHTGDTADAMPAGAVDNYYAQLEVMQQLAKERRDAAQVALESTQSAKATIVQKYGDAHTVVAGELSGDSRFLDAGGSSAAPAGSLAGQTTWRGEMDDLTIPARDRQYT